MDSLRDMLGCGSGCCDGLRAGCCDGLRATVEDVSFSKHLESRTQDVGRRGSGA